MDLQVGVKILIKNAEGKYLLLFCSAEKYPEVGAKWDIVGGRIDKGSSLMENLKREVFEESGLELAGEPKLIAAQDILKSDKHVVRLTYTGEAKGDIVLSDEHSQYKWFTIGELQDLESLDRYVQQIVHLLI